MIKWLRKILPPTRRYFNKAIKELGDRLTKKITSLQKSQEKELELQHKVLRKFSDIGNEVQELENKIISIENKMDTLIDNYKKTENSINQEIKLIQTTANSENNNLTELIWANIFHDSIVDSMWLKHKTFSLGRWAVGYHFMYPLYRILNEFQPNRILELGLGQTTVMIGQYANYYDAEHTVVEHDTEWVKAFKLNFELPENTNPVVLELDTRSYLDDDSNNIYSYRGFSEQFIGNKYDLITIDGPFGFGSERYARVDVLDILPKCLMPSFVIMLDDTNRNAEKATIREFQKKLDEHHIEYETGEYNGIKGTTMIVSKDLKFLCSL